MNARLRPALRNACLALLPLIALAACQGKEKTGAGAEGEILPGSASDAMLPLDTVRSQPPLASPEKEGAGKKDAGSGEDASETTEADSSVPAAARTGAPEPAATQTGE